MNANILQIHKQINKRKEQKLYEIKPVGSAIKFKRKEMNMTLEEGAEGICSVSYLSKLENNLIHPGIQFIDLLMDRFNLTDTFNNDYNLYVSHIDLIIDSMISVTDSLDNIILEYGTRKDYQAFLIRLGVYTINMEFEKAGLQYNELRTSIPNLNDNELSLLLICLSEMLYHQNQYSDAYKVLLCAPPAAKIDSRLVLLLMKNRLLNAFRMHKVADILSLYSEYVNQLIDYQYYHFLQDIKNKYVLFQSIYQEPYEIKRKLSKMKQISKYDKSYTLAQAHFNHQQYDEVIKYTTQHYKKCSRFLILHLISLDYLSQENQINQVLEETNQMTNLCQTVKLIITHLRHKYSRDKTKLLNYLRREILGIKALTDDYQVLDYLMFDTQHLFSEYQHYKEAVQVTKKFLPKLKMLKRTEQGRNSED
ncbi:helix-turn-helix domain-containing protein [Peloplasma aerotolerans]|uniref:Helix-turn-helix transcriptional regulator n=1 Tax=Peloplasma aerotolerans TaxID=3044389 RepID=A0AAW6U451_9MOLU|nr:helix-turn-helix transcriptional regulator [Mariniplasma sp. M4Ah]MDI6452687.1 helix-turn-helix transcriptional regulator [Mariniplasma sp. M4Ah]